MSATSATTAPAGVHPDAAVRLVARDPEDGSHVATIDEFTSDASAQVQRYPVDDLEGRRVTLSVVATHGATATVEYLRVRRHSDDDGYLDAHEPGASGDLTVPDALVDGTAGGHTVQLNPARADTDGDDLDDGAELDQGTDPSIADTDGDGADWLRADGNVSTHFEGQARAASRSRTAAPNRPGRMPGSGSAAASSGSVRYSISHPLAAAR